MLQARAASHRTASLHFWSLPAPFPPSHSCRTFEAAAAFLKQSLANTKRVVSVHEQILLLLIHFVGLQCNIHIFYSSPKMLSALFVLGGSPGREVGEGTCMCLVEQKSFIRQHREAPGRKADLALLEVNFIYLDNFIVDVLVTKKNYKKTQKNNKFCSSIWPCSGAAPKGGALRVWPAARTWGGMSPLPVTLSSTESQTLKLPATDHENK